MSPKKTPKSIQCLQQLKDIFALNPWIRDIDFSQWYKSVSMIVECGEYMGTDFPSYDNVFQIKFKSVSKFLFNIDPISTEYLGENDICGLAPAHKALSQEYDDKNRSYYKLILATGVTHPISIEICFTDAEVAYLGETTDLRKIDPGGGFLSSKAKEKMLYQSKYAPSGIEEDRNESIDDWQSRKR
jgi:hypothetical protein